MDLNQSSFSGKGAPQAPPLADPRPEPTPDHTALRPCPRVQASEPVTDGPGTTSGPNRFGPVLAVAAAVLLAIFVLNIGTAYAAWTRFANLFAAHPGQSASAKQPLPLDDMKPQRQAEALLELAVRRDDAAVDQISSRVDRWKGKVKWDPQIATLTTAALNSSDLRVRESGIEVELAAYGLAKNAASLDYLLTTVESRDHAQKIWALWALGLLANRGVGTGRAVQVLTGHLHDSEEDSRRWAVEGLALAGADQAIAPLLQTMRNDPSPSVRERAACALAESGMFTPEQRLTAVPQLLNYTDDPSLDSQTHAWAFQALADITRQRLPNDSTAWRRWYESSRSDSF